MNRENRKRRESSPDFNLFVREKKAEQTREMNHLWTKAKENKTIKQ